VTSTLGLEPVSTHSPHARARPHRHRHGRGHE